MVAAAPPRCSHAPSRLSCPDGIQGVPGETLLCRAYRPPGAASAVFLCGRQAQPRLLIPLRRLLE